MLNTALLINFNTISINVKDFTQNNLYKFNIINGNDYIYSKKIQIVNEKYIITLSKNINIKEKSKIVNGNNDIFLHYDLIFNTKEFDDMYYTNSKLGCFPKDGFTEFFLWSPAAKSVNLIMYKNGKYYQNEYREIEKMVEIKNGVWYVKVNKDLIGYFYNYEVNVYDEINEVVDPYAKAVGINGLRGAIIDLGDTNPENFKSKKRIPFEDSILYEASVRDMTTDPNAKVKNRGKFLGLTECGNKNEVSTGFTSVKDLGVTHIQFMPIYDFSYESTDEMFPYKYNWGYDPQNYNVPEGSYATDAFDPKCRIFELKKLIKYIHDNDMYVNMDVVYNHVYKVEDSNLEKIFPLYFFRHYEDGSISNGTGVGNDIASERSMVRRYIIDSMLYWVKEYNVDGFRMDLMGILDIQTINELRSKLDEIDENIMLYGEGWNLDTNLGINDRATIINSNKMNRVGFFNDTFRNVIRGDNFDHCSSGYISGKNVSNELVKFIVSGSCNHNFGMPIFSDAIQSINYICCHDDLTVFDKVRLGCPNDITENYKDMVKLGAAIMFTSKGIPFVHEGMEFLRTKNFVSNSYNSTDLVNRIDWDRKKEFIDVYNYFKTLIAIRKKYKSLRDSKGNVNFIDLGENTISFLLNESSYEELLVICNGEKSSKYINLPVGNWVKILDKYSQNLENETVDTKCIKIHEISSMIFYKKS